MISGCRDTCPSAASSIARSPATARRRPRLRRTGRRMLGAFFAERVEASARAAWRHRQRGACHRPGRHAAARAGPARRQAAGSKRSGRRVRRNDSRSSPSCSSACKNISKGVQVEMSWDELSTYGNGAAEPAEKPLIAHAAGSAQPGDRRATAAEVSGCVPASRGSAARCQPVLRRRHGDGRRPRRPAGAAAS